MASPLNPLAARTVYLKLHPTARSFSERREVLRVLERFGEVTMFKSYKYSPRNPTPNTFLALFATDTAAQELINASPIRYRLIANPSSISSSESSPISSDTPSSAIPPTHSTENQLSPNLEPQSTQQQEVETAEVEREEGIVGGAEERPFQLHAYPSTFSHTLYLGSPLHSPLHGPYKPINSRNSYIASSLERIIPKSLYSAGLMDWETDSGRSNNLHEEMKKVDEFGMGRVGEGKEAYWFERRQREKKAKKIPRVMEGLRGLRREWEAGENGKEGEVEAGKEGEVDV